LYCGVQYNSENRIFGKNDYLSARKCRTIGGTRIPGRMSIEYGRTDGQTAGDEGDMVFENTTYDFVFYRIKMAQQRWKKSATTTDLTNPQYFTGYFYIANNVHVSQL